MKNVYAVLTIIILLVGALIGGFILWDTPREMQQATQPRVTESPSYWHYLDSIDPKEDTAHIIPYEEIHPREEVHNEN